MGKTTVQVSARDLFLSELHDVRRGEIYFLCTVRDLKAENQPIVAPVHQQGPSQGEPWQRVQRKLKYPEVHDVGCWELETGHPHEVTLTVMESDARGRESTLALVDAVVALLAEAQAAPSVADLPDPAAPSRASSFSRLWRAAAGGGDGGRNPAAGRGGDPWESIGDCFPALQYKLEQVVGAAARGKGRDVLKWLAFLARGLRALVQLNADDRLGNPIRVPLVPATLPAPDGTPNAQTWCEYLGHRRSCVEVLFRRGT